ncbi:MAG: Acyl-CoA dehydrogenase, short-chain specific [Myxococcales bacterium]|nr:Acyl-CoA dehydrogenase, short-chain specific [Myxococcales bacterium]
MGDDETPASFGKSLFFGHIPESLVVPYPTMRKEDQDALKLILDQFKKFAANEIDSRKIDEEARLPPSVIEGMRALGLFGLAIPEAHGGLGLSVTGYARAFQEIAGVDGSIAVTLGGHQSIGCKGLVLYGSDEQQARYLPRLATGELIAAFALTEPGSGSDAASIKTRATVEPDGSFVLNGSKIWITNGGIADFFTVFAQTEVTRDGAQKDRISAFLVERKMGVTSGAEEHKLGIKGSSTTALYFDNVKVPKENLLGQLGGGFKVAMGVLNNGRLGLAAGAVGAAEQVMKLALAHATSRRQFGRAIADFGLIKDKIARMMMEIYAAESMVYLTTGLIDRGIEDYSVESACCKVYGSEMLWRVVNESLQIAAGVGYMKEFPYERLLRDARINLIFEGTNEILRCFIALSGMQGPGDRLAQLSDAIKWPLKGYGLVADFVMDKIKTQYYGGERLDHIHPAFKKEAVLFEDWVPELAKNVEKVLRKHGKVISEMQYVQRRVADIVIDLFMMVACMSRATLALNARGPEAEREAKLCRAVCGRASQRIKRNIRRFDDNDDELLKSIAKDAYDSMEYDHDIVLGR